MRSLSEQGYSLYSIHRQVLLAACFSRWLKQQGVALRSITSDHPRRYLRYRARQVRPSPGDVAALRHLLDFLRCKGVIPAEKMSACALTPAERYTQAYEHHLREARGLASATIANYVPFIRGFLEDRFGEGPVTLSNLCANDVVRFVQCQAPRLHPKRAKLLTSALRSFLQYASYRGKTKLDLAAAVPVVANWSMLSIPRAIPADQVRQLLTSIDRRTAMGCRDYAILLLLARLGLRSGEAAFLELDDIDWNTGKLSVRGKSGRRITRAEVDALLAAPDQCKWSGRRDHAFILLAVQTGLRLSEMTGLQRQDIILGAGAHVRVIGKGRKERCTPIAKSTLAVLRAWLREPQRGDGHVLFPNAKGKRLSVHGVQYLLNKHRVTASNACPSFKQKRVTVHRLRHTMAMDLLQAARRSFCDRIVARSRTC